MSRHDNPSDPQQGAAPGDEHEWTVVATAPDQLTAEMWQQLLWQESIPAALDPHDTISFMGVASIPVRVLVPVESVVKARDILAGVQGAADWIEPEASNSEQG